MSGRRLLVAAAAVALLGIAAAVVLGAFGLVTPPTEAVYGLTPGRLWALVGVLLGLTGVVIGGLALARSAGHIGNGDGKRGAVLALVTGLPGTVIGALVVAAAEGGPGTGYGIVGGFFALVIGLVATVLGWLALARSRRTV